MRNEIFYASNICAAAQRGADLKNLSLSLFTGEVLGLFGNRYAGKNALFQVMMGTLPISSGQILWNGSTENPRPSIVKIDKNTKMIDEMQVWENIAILWKKAAPGEMLDSVRMRNMIRLYFQDCQFPIELTKKTSQLSLMDKLIIEILIALRQKNKILLVGIAGVEGTAQEFTRLKTLLLQVKEADVSIIIFGHQLEIISYLTDRIAVIYNGRIIKQLEKEAVTAQTLQNMKNTLYPVEKREKPKAAETLECVMQIRGLDAGLQKPVEFDLNRGEFMAVVSPQLELFQILQNRIMTGEQEKTSSVVFRGKPVKKLGENQGVFFLNTRYLDVLIDEMSPLENLCMGISDKAGTMGFENRNITACIERDFYEWYGHEGILRKKDCRMLYRKDRIAINLFRLRFLKIDVLFCNALSVHNDLLTYQMVEDALIAMAQSGTAVCIVTNDFAYDDELVERYVVLGESKI